MEYKKPTYEEYLNATKYAKIRYKFGVYIQLIAFLLLIFLFIYVFKNAEELKTNPLEYTEKKLGISCICLDSNLIQQYNLENGNGRNNKST